MNDMGAFPLHQCLGDSTEELGFHQFFELVESTGHLHQRENEQQRTPLMVACSVRNPNPGIIKGLLLLGADPDEKDANGLRALDLAR